MRALALAVVRDLCLHSPLLCDGARCSALADGRWRSLLCDGRWRSMLCDGRWRSMLCDGAPRLGVMALRVSVWPLMSDASCASIDAMNEWGLLLKRRAHNLL